jgi:hypothetical protein
MSHLYHLEILESQIATVKLASDWVDVDIQIRTLFVVDGQVHLVRLVHLQMDYFRFTTNLCLLDEQTINGLRKIAWASIFYLIFFLKHQNSPIF